MRKESQQLRSIFLMIGIGLFLMTPLASYGGGQGLDKGLLKKYSAEWWQWSLSVPAGVNPLEDADGSYCSVGQHGKIWFLGGTLDGSPAERHCTIPRGKSIFFPVINAECSVVEGYGETSEELSESAKDLIDHVTEVEVLVDGIPLKHVEKSRVQSKLFEFSLPPDDVFGLYGKEPNPSPAVSDGYWVMLSPLPVGKHIIEYRGVAFFPEWDNFEFIQDIKYHITIAEP